VQRCVPRCHNFAHSARPDQREHLVGGAHLRLGIELHPFYQFTMAKAWRARSHILGELFSKPGDFFTRWRPVRVAGVAVEHQRAGRQRFFEFFLTECNCLVVVVRTVSLELQAVAHEPSCCLLNFVDSSRRPFDGPAGNKLYVQPLGQVSHCSSSKRWLSARGDFEWNADDGNILWTGAPDNSLLASRPYHLTRRLLVHPSGGV